MRRSVRLGRFGLLMLMATAILVVPVFSPAGTNAQKPAGDDATGKITGTVTDNKGVGISGARVTITNVDTQVAVDVTTDDNGKFEAFALPLGSYRVGAELYGLRKALSTAHKLLANQTLKFDVRLETEGPSETVMVTSIAPEPSSKSPEPAKAAPPVRVPFVVATNPQNPGPQVVVPTTVVPGPQSPGRQKDRTGAAQPDAEVQTANVVWVVVEEPPANQGYKEGSGEPTVSPVAPTIAPVDRSWSSAGSAGTIDEDSLTIAQVQNFTINLLPAATGSVRVRYNITAVDGTSSFCPATNSIIKIRYRDSDGVSNTARVLLEFRTTNVNSGGNTLIATFDSNLFAGAGNAFVTVAGNMNPVDFDFTNNIYWIDATVTRSSASQFADLGSLQLWESAGTACP